MCQRYVGLSEILERRLLLDAVLEPGGILRVTGTANADVISMAVRGTVPKVHVDINGRAYQFQPSAVTSIAIDLKEGNDRLDIGRAIGGVYVLGGEGYDTIVGGAGSDTLVSGGGKDLIFGGDGDDRLDGGPTADRLFGENGADRIYGGEANDYLDGGAGVDRLFAETGNDLLVGGSSNDKLYGDAGNDTLRGLTQNDLLNGGDGNDDLSGGEGFDTLNGQGGNDILNGQQSDDALFGDAGRDSLVGGAGNDALKGGDDDDVLRGSDGNDQLFGDRGNDFLHGETNNDLLDGGDGHDSLNGGAGTDSLYGGLGNDALLGGADADTLGGNGGSDRFYSYDADTHVSRTDADALIGFGDGDVAWTEDEIWQLDKGLATLQARTGNTRLLKFASGDTMVLRRVASLGVDTMAINDGNGEIKIADLAFTETTIPEWATIIHEIGHNWDETDENPSFGTFNEISHWRRVGGQWQFQPGTLFARDYGKTNPVEDFATALEVYFFKSKPASQWQVKWDYIDGWLDSLSG
ncbi:MAG: hypothetical protein QOF78_493 [Phycisphaerales bacterium]|jgi:Ca2+-binding RTX toxin-like protein|nr:hypothetical protein [Phycisphaerales bacterium]